MNISVTYDDTDIAKALKLIVNHPNSEEIVKLITPMLCDTSKGAQYFMKCLIGKSLPDVLPVGTLCKIKVDGLGYSAERDNIRNSDLADDNGCVIVTVKEFKGYHGYTNYEISYTNILDSGVRQNATSQVNLDYLEQIKEF